MRHISNILDFLKQAVGRNMDIKLPAGEDSEESKKHGRESLYTILENTCTSDVIINRILLEM